MKAEDFKPNFSDTEAVEQWLETYRGSGSSPESRLWCAMLEMVIFDLSGKHRTGRWKNYQSRHKERDFKSALSWVKRESFDVGGLDWMAETVLKVAPSALRKGLLALVKQ